MPRFTRGTGAPGKQSLSFAAELPSLEGCRVFLAILLVLLRGHVAEGLCSLVVPVARFRVRPPAEVAPAHVCELGRSRPPALDLKRKTTPAERLRFSGALATLVRSRGVAQVLQFTLTLRPALRHLCTRDGRLPSSLRMAALSGAPGSPAQAIWDRCPWPLLVGAAAAMGGSDPEPILSPSSLAMLELP